jgi:hypothetical protein
MFKTTHVILVFCLLFLFGCLSRSNNSDQDKLDVSLDTPKSVTLKLSDDVEEDILFYNMLYPMDLGVIIDKRNANYNSDLLNPLTNSSNYAESSKKALAMGVYGADVSYLWGFNQEQQALAYFMAVKYLALDMGIPNEYVNSSANKAEMYNDNMDSLVNIARQAYYDYDSYLIKSNKQDLAVMVLYGGWIETMHIALNLYTQPNSRMACKIISQKYSLSSLLNLLYQQADDVFISNYSTELINLLGEFDRLQNAYFSDNLEIDTVHKTITFITSATLELNPDEFKHLKELIGELRELIIR